MNEIKRNDPCHCGSGRKFKQCCLGKGKEIQAAQRTRKVFAAIVASAALGALTGFAINPLAGKLLASIGIASAIAWYILAVPPVSKGGGDPSSINFGN